MATETTQRLPAQGAPYGDDAQLQLAAALKRRMGKSVTAFQKNRSGSCRTTETSEFLRIPLQPIREKEIMKHIPVVVVMMMFAAVGSALAADGEPRKKATYEVHPIGWVRKAEGRTTIVVDKKYEPALLGVEKLSQIWVIWWFDRNDTPEKRAILQVHPQGNKNNPLTGVFATHSPVRPNLIAITRCKIISVKDNVIEIEGIDAFPDTPVLDFKS
jgi:tRNA-Thr(GGU) m(6)t(6)A37 methyltransferase TsaA